MHVTVLVHFHKRYRWGNLQLLKPFAQFQRVRSSKSRSRCRLAGLVSALSLLTLDAVSSRGEHRALLWEEAEVLPSFCLFIWVLILFMILESLWPSQPPQASVLNTAALGLKLQYFPMNCIWDSKLKLQWPIKLESWLWWVLYITTCLV